MIASPVVLAMRCIGRATILQRLLFDDFQVQLPDCYLTKVDVASMAASLEVRAPLARCVSAGNRLAAARSDETPLGGAQVAPQAHRSTPGSSEVIYRPKMGFAMPLQRWFQGEIGIALEHLLKESVAEREGWIDSKRVICELEDHRNGKRDNHTRLWLILCLEIWFRIVTGGLDYHADLSNGHLPVGRRRSHKSRRVSSADSSSHRTCLHGAVFVPLR